MLLKISKLFLYAALFSVVIVVNISFFPFIGGKYYFFRVSVELALMMLIFWWAFEAKPGEFKALFDRVAKKPLFIAVSAFVLAYLLASVFAHNPHGAFWSNFERGEGAFQMLHYYAFFVLLVFLLRNRADWRLAMKLFLVAAVLMVLYGVFAQAGWGDKFISPYRDPSAAPQTFWGKLSGTRFQGSLGNPAYVAPYLMFALFYAFYLWLDRSFKNKWLEIVVYGGGSAFFLLFFVLSQTRGAFLGLAAAVLAFLVYLIVKSPSLKKRAAVALAALILVGGLLFSYRDSDFVKKLPLSRFLDLGFSERTIQTRIWTWNSAWQGFKERPLLGWGPENFSTVFDKYFDPRHYVPGTNSETWFDRAHSVFFGYLADTGILGFASYLAIFAVFYYEFLKRIKPLPETSSSGRGAGEGETLGALKKSLLFALPVGYLAQGFVLFDVLPIYMSLFLSLAFAFYLFYGSKKEIHA